MSASKHIITVVYHITLKTSAKCFQRLRRKLFISSEDFFKMRPLTDEEMRALFEKLHIYIGQNVAKLIDRSDEAHTFRLVKDRVYYLSEAQMKLATNIGRENLICLGTCFGKFTKSGKFRIHVTCLDYLAQYAKYKVWVKPGAEMSFLYGNNVTKAGLARITEGTDRSVSKTDVCIHFEQLLMIMLMTRCRSTCSSRSEAVQAQTMRHKLVLFVSFICVHLTTV
jgi:60S ribosome subunit biogenesis protein NIP7